MVSGTAAAILAYGGASGMLQMMHSSDSSSSEALAALMSPRSGPGHHSSAGGNVAAGREEAVAGQQTGSPTASAGNLKRAFFPAMFEASEETGEDDDMGQPTEKKRRLSVEQVRSLEKNFEVENKLEPERKMQLARDLGLQPRQVAVWFQNRRARWKTKQLEKDYEVLKADFDALKGDYTALAEEKDKLVAEVKRLNAAITSPTAVEPILSEVSNASSSEGLKKPEKLVSEHLSDPPAIPLKAVAPTDATSVATTKAMPALPQAPLTKPVLIPPELLAIPIPSSKDLDTKDYQLSPTSVSNFPGGNSNLRESIRRDSGIYGAGGGSPHHSGNSSDTNSVSSVSDMCNVDSPHHSPIDSSYSGKFLPMLLQQQQQVQKSMATSSEFSGEGSMSTWPSTTASAGFDDSCCSSLSSLNVDLSFPTPGTPAQTCMLANLNMESPFCDLVADDFCNQRLLNSPPGFGAPRVKIEEGGVMALHSDELSSHVFNMDDQSLAFPWWDWP